MSSGVNERMTHPWYEAISIKLFLGIVGALMAGCASEALDTFSPLTAQTVPARKENELLELTKSQWAAALAL